MTSSVRKWMIGLAALAGLTLVGGVMLVGRRGLPGAYAYRPASPREERAIASSTRDVYPDDVRADLLRHQVQVAWAGLLQQIEFGGSAPHIVATVTVEHHYFDWIEDHGAQSEIHLMSPRGEGSFRCSWPVDPAIDVANLRRFVVAGTMVVAYGTPARRVPPAGSKGMFVCVLRGGAVGADDKHPRKCPREALRVPSSLAFLRVCGRCCVDRKSVV